MSRFIVVRMFYVGSVLVFLLSQHNEVISTPVKYSNWKEYLERTGKKHNLSTENQCTHGGPIRDLCEKCTKFTKNEVVFPLCCLDEDNARSWCDEFLNYSPDDQSSSS